MKRLFNGHIFFGSMAAREGDEFIENAMSEIHVRPTALRWFGGMHDIDCGYVCQVL